MVWIVQNENTKMAKPMKKDPSTTKHVLAQPYEKALTKPTDLWIQEDIRMPELRQEPSTKEWVIIATERAKRPHEFQRPNPPVTASGLGCVFCPGNEHKTPPELWRFPYRR